MIGVIALVATLVLLANYAFSQDEEIWDVDNVQFSGGTGGYFLFDDSGTATSLSYNLGLTYIPDHLTTFAQSPLAFWTNQVVRQGSYDMNMTGIGYRLYTWDEGGISLYLEAAGTTKRIAEDKYKVGAYSGVRIPFSVSGQAFRFTAGGGWDGDDPIMVLALNFVAH